MTEKKTKSKQKVSNELNFDNLTTEEVKSKMIDGAMKHYNNLIQYLDALPLHKQVMMNVFYNLDTGMLWFKNFINSITDKKTEIKDKEAKEIEELKSTQETTSEE